MLSSFSMISLLGVVLGVLVLVVVMAIYSGLERNVKSRLLGFTPHVLLTMPDDFTVNGAMTDWQAEAEKAAKMPHVESATAYVSDNVIVDKEKWQRPVMFQGIDTTDAGQVKSISGMLDRKNYPASTADLGLEDKTVISSILAKQLAVGVGDTLRLYSTRNFDQVIQAYKATEDPPLREKYADGWKPAAEVLGNGFKEDGKEFLLPAAGYRAAYAALLEIYDQPVRVPEHERIERILKAMDNSEVDDAADSFRFQASDREEIRKAVAEIADFDQEKLDAEVFKGLKNIVLPKEAEIAGVYQASQMAVTPDLFVPLPLAQTLSGLDSSVLGISLRLDDPYQAEVFAAAARKSLGPGYSLVTWGDQNQAFFALIEQQRGMMYFLLSFIILVSAFSMMAVMFTVTIQKRREIGVMKALGATSGQIVRVFLYQGMILGILGAILGVGLGRVVIHFRGSIQALFRTVGFDPFTSQFTGFDTLPAHNNLGEQAIFALMAFVLCSIAAFVPAFFAARSDAAKSLRNL